MNLVRTKKAKPRAQPMDNMAPTHPLPTIKNDNLKLHDEADLINFRSDAFNRFLTNQDLLETVVLKPFHTSKIKPPSSFPIPREDVYPKDATDEDLRDVLKNLNRDDHVLGDLRLMKVKNEILESETKDTQQELEQLIKDPTTTVFGEEVKFQQDYAKKLGNLFRECNDEKSLEALEQTYEEALRELESKHKKRFTVQQHQFTRKSIPIEELNPEAQVQKAPENYNPSSFMNTDQTQKPESDGSGEQPPNDNYEKVNDGDKIENDQFLYLNENGDDDFAMSMMNSGNVEGRDLQPSNENVGERPANGGPQFQGQGPSFEPRNGQNFQNGGFELGDNSGSQNALLPNAEQGSPEPQNNPPNDVQPTIGDEDVNMDDLNDFLADPQDDGEIVGQDMDALMNFDQTNDGGGIIEDDAFNSDFLSQIGNGMD